jgi:DNA-3-methyladenine glycosylase
MKKLNLQFYERADVISIARELIGKIIVTKFNRIITSARIVETEAYVGLTDRASHSFGGRRTARNEHMYADPGTSYVYICYGMHHLFNVVTNKKGIPDAVLIRAVEPIKGIEMMLLRTNKKKLDNTLTKGPGNVGKALGISKQSSGLDLRGNKIFIAEDELSYEYHSNNKLVGTSSRIGIEGAGKAAVLLPYRFYVKGNRFVSGSPNK